MKLENQNAREEIEREEEEEEKTRIEGGGKKEVTVAVEIIRRSEEEMTRLVTRDQEDGDLSMRDQNVTLELAELEVSLHATPVGTDNTPLVNVYTTA